MAIRINSNIAAMNAQRRLGESTAALSQTFTRLSSGLRINRASDDAAGLAIASGLNADARIYNTALRNVNDAISAVQVAEGALSELSSIAIRLGELSEQAANGVYQTAQRSAMDREAQALVAEFNRIVAVTEFNGRSLISGTGSTLSVQAGPTITERMNFSIGGLLASEVGTGTFTDGGLFSPSNLQSNELADFNGDGILDIVGGAGAGTATIQIGNGNGTFKAANSITNGLPVGTVLGLDVADVNGDGSTDVVFAGAGSNFTGVILGNGNGSFKAMVTYATVQNAISIELFDVNGDGALDILSSSENGDLINVQLGNGNGTFKTRISVGTGALGLTESDVIGVADVNGDSKLDLLVAGNSIFLHLGNGDGTFSFARTFQPVSTQNATYVTTGDLNNDGNVDMVMGSTVNGFGQVWLGDGTGNFTVSEANLGGGNQIAAGLRLVDLDGDNYLDLVRNGLTTTNVYLSNGNGTFRAPNSNTSANASAGISIGDIDSDGVNDIVIGHAANGASVLFGDSIASANIAELDLSTQAGAREALTAITEVRARINAEIGNLGSIQSRLEVAGKNISTLTLNLRDAASRIQDADVATEAANLVKARILQNAGAAVLAQANQGPALALALLADI